MPVPLLYLRQDTEGLAATNPINLKVPIHGEYEVRVELFRKHNKRGICEIHR